MSQHLVSVDDLVVEFVTDGYSVRPLDGFTMQAPAGRLVALLGPSGSGKTTLLSILSGMIQATSGSVRVNGIDVLSLSGAALEEYRRSTIGIVFQGFNLIPSLSARENVAAPLLLAGVKSKKALARADELLDEVGLADRSGHKPLQLSGGQQQRVAVARGLISDPLVLLADEPTANLDHISAESVVDLLRRLRERGRTIIISTHDDRLLPAVDMVVAMHPDHPLPPAGETPDDVELEPGEILFRQSSPSDFVYEILHGTVEILRENADGRHEIIAMRDAGSYVGELGPMLGFLRSATVRAGSRTRVRPMTIETFRSNHDARTT